MKIIYVANHLNNGCTDTTEDHITGALRWLGHEVIRLEEDVKTLPDGDILLFHKWASRIPFKGKKVCWYFDKIWKRRGEEMARTLEYADKVFMTDGTWADKQNNPKISVLRQGIGNSKLGEVKNIDYDVVFVGSLYDERIEWANKLRKRYGGRFRATNSTYNNDLSDLCASVPIIIAPEYPSDDNYFSNRAYLITGSGGFLIHPRSSGLLEDFTEKEIVMYKGFDEMCEKIDYYLKNKEEREKIRLAGYNKTKKQYNIIKRVHTLLQQL